MVSSQEQQLQPLYTELSRIRKNWGWFLALGIVLIALGIACVSSSLTATLLSVMVLGFLILTAGVVQIAQAFLSKNWSGVFLSILLGILYIIVGFLFVTKPESSAVSLTLLIAVLCFTAGLFKMIASALLRFQHWGWVFFNGAITFILGILIYSDWPISGLWVIGLFVGIDLILAGWSWVLLSLGIRNYIR